MEIAIKVTETLEGQPSPYLLIQFGENQVTLNQEEFKSLQKNIDVFVDSGVKIIGYSTYFKPSDNHSEYLEIRTRIKGEEHCEEFALKHRKEREKYLDYMKEKGMISEEEYIRCISGEQSHSGYGKIGVFARTINQMNLEFKTKRQSPQKRLKLIKKIFKEEDLLCKKIEFLLVDQELDQKDSIRILDKVKNSINEK